MSENLPIVADATKVRTALYRHFDSEGSLLYVGISLSVTARMAQHRDASAWYSMIARVEVEWFDSRLEALSAEREAIKSESPRFNIQHRNKKDERALLIERKADESRAELTRHVARYMPAYSLKGVSELTGISVKKLRRALALGHMPHFMDGPREMVTGWAVIAYLEALESGEISVPSLKEGA